MVDLPEDQEPEVKVTDRRHFTPDGERVRRSDEEAEPPREEQPGASGEAESQPAGGERADFGTLVMGLANTAMIHMGEIKDPHHPGAEPNLPAAREVIDLLGLLQEKTRGNLTGEEQHLLDTLLFKLRMDYTEKAAQR